MFFFCCYLSTDDLQISQEAFYQPRHDCTDKESPYFREMCRPIVCWTTYRCNLGTLKDSTSGYLFAVFFYRYSASTGTMALYVETSYDVQHTTIHAFPLTHPGCCPLRWKERHYAYYINSFQCLRLHQS